MARPRRARSSQGVAVVDLDTSDTVETQGNNAPEQQESKVMSESVFEALSQEEWQESGAGSTAEKGEYGRILAAFVASEQRYAKINTESGRFAGRKASSIGTALKNARDSKNAPEGVGEHIRITSKNAAVFLENEQVAA